MSGSSDREGCTWKALVTQEVPQDARPRPRRDARRLLEQSAQVRHLGLVGMSTLGFVTH
jgi:hypothetical protein